MILFHVSVLGILACELLYLRIVVKKIVKTIACPLKAGNLQIKF